MNAVDHLLRARSAVQRMSAESGCAEATRAVALWSIDEALGELGYTVPPPRAPAGADRGRERPRGAARVAAAALAAVAVLCAVPDSAHAQEFVQIWHNDAGDRIGIRDDSYIQEGDVHAILVRIVNPKAKVTLGHAIVKGTDCARGFGNLEFLELSGLTADASWAAGSGTGFSAIAKLLCDLRKRASELRKEGRL